MKKARLFGVIAILTVTGFSFTGCRTDTPEPTVIGVTVDGPSSVTIARGGTHAFTATVAGTNDPPQTVIWAIVQTNRHAQTTINANTGALSVAASETLTTLTVRATSTFNTRVSGTVTVTIPAPQATVTGVTVDGPSSVTVARGGTHAFTATVAGTNDPPQTVTWAIVQTNRHAQTTINANTGVLSVAASETLATLTIRATSTLDPTRSGTIAVIVIAPYATVTGVTVDPETVAVARGGTHAFTATVAGTNNPPQTVTWAIVQTNTHAQTTINATSGVLSVAADETLTWLTVRATSTFNTAVSGTAIVAIPVPPPITVTGVTVDPETVAVARGGTHTFTATVAGTNNPPQTVTWAIVQANRHAQTTINENTGVLSVAASETLAWLIVRATSTFNTAISGTAIVTVTDPVLQPIANAEITVAAPVAGAIPDTVAVSTGDFSVGAVSWSPVHSLFQGGTVYSATVTLTADTGFTFTGGLTGTVTVNGTPVIPSIAGDGGTATLAHTFGPTDETDHEKGSEANPFWLDENVWASGEITTPSGDFWFSFDVVAGTTYRLWWNDSHHGDGTKTMDTRVFIFNPNGTHAANSAGEDSRWNTPFVITPAQSGTVRVRFTGWISGNIGTFGIVYSSGTVRPPPAAPPPQTKSFTLGFTALTDRADGILDIGDLSLLGLSREPAAITLKNPGGHTFGNIRWLFDGQDIGDGTKTLTLGARVNGQMLKIGEHFLTVVVEIDGRAYGSRIAFRVTP